MNSNLPQSPTALSHIVQDLQIQIIRTRKHINSLRASYKPFSFDTIGYISDWPFTTPEERQTAFRAIESAKRWANQGNEHVEERLSFLTSHLRNLLCIQKEAEEAYRKARNSRPPHAV